MLSKRGNHLPWISSVLLFFCGLAHADVKLPHIFGDHMVFQQGVDLPIWGWADPGEPVTVRLGHADPVSTTTDSKGCWRVHLAPALPGNPLQLIVKGKNEIVLEDVLVGEVWVGSGQSNMAWLVKKSDNAEHEVQAASHPKIRFFTVPREPSAVPRSDVDSSWEICDPNTVGDFSACAYFFGREIHKELGVPVGLINSSWGGTRIEPWTPPVGFEKILSLQEIHQQLIRADPTSDPYKKKLSSYIQEIETWLAEAKVALAQEKILSPVPEYPKDIVPLANHLDPTALYNGMIHPLIPFAIRGFIWYQGESNRLDGDLYTCKMQALIDGWRKVWEIKDLPFYYVQIAPFQYEQEDPGILPQFWTAQRNVLERVPHTGMVVVHDIGDLNDIHPTNKQEVGRRLALWALAQTYGMEDVVHSGPLYKGMKVENDAIRILFDHVGGGLASRDGQALSHFEILGIDEKYVPAQASIDGNTLLVRAQGVTSPVAVRFAWHKLAEPNLMNKEGLPASPFLALELE